MELKNKKDFEWHKKTLDLKLRHECCHQGTPEKYPCRVESNFWDDPNGPYTYGHTFIYQQSVKCEKCGHTQLEWPDVEGAHYDKR